MSWLNKSVFLSLLLCSLSSKAFTVTDSLGEHEFEKAAVRVITLNWGATEEVIELGLVPIGIADMKGYREWVSQPSLPDSVDVGSRGEPNLEVLSALKPDLIVIGSGQKDLLERLQGIAPVLFFDNFRSDHKNSKAIDASFLQLAKALGVERNGQQRLARRDEVIKQYSQQLHEMYGANLPNTTLIRFVSESHARMYGKNSTVEFALQQLGIREALVTKNSVWGQTQRPLTDLAKIENGIVLYILPFAYEEKLKSLPLWQHLPVVRKGNVGTVGPVWTYGGALSIEYLAREITQSLLNLNRSK
ncbi:iron-siderophore ABC transporter substrate-binding protein [Vibrio sp.]|uniref:Iron-siderophore ABC transporter substrate-binding protein n=1 Tax=Vibrio viridaestus TaxID=2487322 RepID=A0A3N9U579_9VIBR|nr:iron-siderophore ABC transporter substrate-binding protein [Vibrio viridaestus]MDC0611850.1 iron-siderophore ABC transporter substrate-binding protein [Vibrio sp.]RQW64852.1 iron-siderophore ABC transporter substrate-binding protein [Vibrio viridaestus]